MYDSKAIGKKIMSIIAITGDVIIIPILGNSVASTLNRITVQ